jgi:hypothetical protein
MYSAKFEPAIPAFRRLQTYAFDRTATESEQKEWRSSEFYAKPTYRKIFHHLAYIMKIHILRLASLEASRYQVVSSEAAASDVTATILLPVSPHTLPSGKQKLHDIFGWPCFIFWSGHRLYCLKYFMVLFSPSNHMPKKCQTQCQAIPFIRSLLIIPPSHSTQTKWQLYKPRLTVQPYYRVAVGRHLHLLRYFSLSVRQKLHVYYLNLLQHTDLYMYSLL